MNGPSCGLLKQADQGESILARQDANGDEAGLIRARLVRLAEEKDTLEARLATLESSVPTSLEESPRQGRVNEHSAGAREDRAVPLALSSACW